MVLTFQIHITQLPMSVNKELEADVIAEVREDLPQLFNQASNNVDDHFTGGPSAGRCGS